MSKLEDFAQEYCDSLYESTDHIALIGDTDKWIAASGVGLKSFYLNKALPDDIQNLIQNRRIGSTDGRVVVPIVAEGDPVG
jgi:AbrB family transcriptional regulator (stage V sporulation protein T)